MLGLEELGLAVHLMDGFVVEGAEVAVHDDRVFLGVVIVAGAAAGGDEAETSIETNGSGAAGADFEADFVRAFLAGPSP